MEVLRVYDVNLERIRLGEEQDGGYIVFDGLEYDYLLSGGIENTIKFESDFIDRYNVMCDAFDNSIDRLPKEHSKIRFHKKSITGEERDGCTNLKSLIWPKKDIYVKMDIEGWEWEWLNALDEDDFKNIKQMSIELHFFMNIDNLEIANLDIFKERLAILDRLNQHFYLIHLHGNNYSKQFFFNGEEYPAVLECVYINKNVILENPNLHVIKNVRSFPSDLDSVNNVNVDDINHLLNKEPFKTKNLEFLSNGY
jgi:hypothetical protein